MRNIGTSPPSGMKESCIAFTEPFDAAVVVVAHRAESRGNPIHAAAGVDVQASAVQPGGNMEGKEVRFGIANSALYATVTTAAAAGAVNAMHDSFTPLGGMVPLLAMQLGELVFGGVGTGNVPADAGAVFVSARKPARAIIGTIRANRPTSAFIPNIVL